MEISQELKKHIEINSNANVYRHLPSVFDLRGGKYNLFIEWDKLTDSMLNEAKKNLLIIAERIEKRKERTEILQGDVVIEKDGSRSRVTVNQWSDSIQVGGGSGSYHMSNGGGASYSGGCGNLIKISELELTNETEEHRFWMFSAGSAGAHRGVDFYAPVKVWKVKND
jgi:hypothetical protein